MDYIADLALQAVLGRGGDFVGGIDNEALDFSQLEAFINSDASQGNTAYFGESLNAQPSTGKLLNVIVENKRQPGHSLPDSPPDSSSENPYSPQENCEQNLPTSDNVYPMYKPSLLNPIITDNLIIGSHIVVADQNAETHLLDGGNILQERLLENNPAGLLNNRLLQDGENLLPERILLQDGTLPEGTNYVDGIQSRRGASEMLLVKNVEYDKPQLVHLGYTPTMEMPVAQRTTLDNSICEPALENIQNVYTNLQNVSKKRKLSQDLPLVKSEPDHCSPSQLSPPSNLTSPLDDDYSPSDNCLSESQYQCIRFAAFQQNLWHSLCDQNLTELPVPHYRVDADKGFNFSNSDDAFVCQKKNHFQVTCHVQLLGDAQFVKTSEGLQKISSFHLHFYGVKHDCPTQTIRVEQSQSDRSKKPFHPVLVELVNSQVTKVTVGRLHFSETTSNNMRKKGKPNPEQRYFQLVVGLHAHTTHGNFPVISHASQKIIVRASNPGQFESDVELCWQKGQTQDSIFHGGKVGINTDRPDESLVVHGNLKITGHIIQPSDVRAKKNIVECDTARQLRNVQKLRVVSYEYEPEFATQLRRSVQNSDTGVIAQEVAKILPEAVSPAGNLILENGTTIDDFLVVNKERIFMENIGAVKELCKVTDKLENRIGQLEKINRTLCKLKRGDSLKSNSTVNSTKYAHSKKCHKHRSCSDETELCSTKFIQVIIVVLVLIMAFCLAAITTLYLIDASRHRQYTQNSLQFKQSIVSTSRPSKVTKYKPRTSTYRPRATDVFRDAGVPKANFNVPSTNKKFPPVVGKPTDCVPEYQNIETSNNCNVYCCGLVPSNNNDVQDLRSYKARLQKQTQGKNKTVAFISLLPKTIMNNNLEKRVQKRDADYNSENTFENTDDQHIAITIEGNNFSTVVTSEYLNESKSKPYNYSYAVPVSKYLPDPFIYIMFKSHQTDVLVEHCSNPLKKLACRLMDYNKTQAVHKVNENFPSKDVLHTFKFKVDMLDFQSKIMTYRLTQSVLNRDSCKISSMKVGSEFTEYNFHFFRQCDG